MAGRELQTMIVLGGRVASSLRGAFAFAETQSNRNISTYSRISQSANRVATGLAKTVLLVGSAATGAFGIMAAKSIKLASDLSEVQNVVDVTFGKDASKINEWSQAATKGFGLSELQAKQFNGTMGAMLKSSGVTGDSLVMMSTKLSGLSGDLASFYNLSQDDAFEKIRSGISGETEPLKALGINMSVANMEAYALSKGIKTSYQNMSQAAQTALRYSYLMDVSKDAQGDFTRTQGGFANQTRLLTTNLNQLGAKIATAVLPAINKLVVKANDFISSISDNPEKIKKIQDAITSFTDATIKFGNDAIPYVKDFANFIKNNWPEIKTIATDIGLVFVTWKVGEKVYDGYRAAKLFYGAVSILSLNLAAAATNYYALILWKSRDIAETGILYALYAKDAIVMAAKTIGIWAMTGAMTAWTAITTIATVVGGAFSAVVAFLTSPIGLVVLAIVALIAVGVLLYKNWDTVSAVLAKVWDGIKSAFAIGVNFVVDKINWLIEKMNKIPGVNIPLIPHMGETPKTVKAYASGGFANSASIFGEAGLEAAIPIKRNNPRSINLLNQTARMIGADNSNQNGINITFAPVLNGSNVSENKAMLQQSYEDFKSVVRQVFADDRRVAFNG